MMFCLVAALVVPSAFSAEPEPAAPPPPTNTPAEMDPQVLRNFLLLQEQLRNTQRAVDQAREQAQADAKRAEELLTARLTAVEQSLNAQRALEISSVQESIRTVILIAIVVTVAGLLAVIFAGFVQVRAMTRLAEVSRQLHSSLPALQLGEGGGHGPLLAREPVEAANANLLGAIDRLEKRLEEMEVAAGETHTATNGHKAIAGPAAANPQVATLLGKGQALLNLDKPEEAVEQFEAALRLEPKNAEAWIKKGTALERLQKVNEAMAAYDEAIAADSSTATAYLFKAGVYNRQKKYAEALQCYEKALSAQQKSRGAAAAARV